MLRGGLTAQHVPAGEAVSCRVSRQHALTAFLPAPRAAGTPGGGPPGLPGSRRPLVSVVLSEVPPPCASLGRPGRPPCPPRLWPQGLSRGRVHLLCGAGLDKPLQDTGPAPQSESRGSLLAPRAAGSGFGGTSTQDCGCPAPRANAHGVTRSHLTRGSRLPRSGLGERSEQRAGLQAAPCPQCSGWRGGGQRSAWGERRGAWGPTAQAVRTPRAVGRAGERPSLCGATFRCARPRGTGGSVGCRESHPGPSWGSDSGRRDPEPLPFGALRRLLGVLCLGWASKKVRRRSWGQGAPHGAGTEPGRAFGAWRTRPFGWGRQQLSVAWGCDIRCTSCPAD